MEPPSNTIPGSTVAIRKFWNVLRHNIIKIPWRIFTSPGIEDPNRWELDCHLNREQKWDQSRGSRMNCWNVIKNYLIRVSAIFSEHTACSRFHCCIIYANKNLFAWCQNPNHFRINFWNWIEISRQCSLLCGHASQVPSCGSHSAGILKHDLFGLLIFNSARLQEWPIFLFLINDTHIAHRDKIRFRICWTQNKNPAIRITDERTSPKN